MRTAGLVVGVVAVGSVAAACSSSGAPVAAKPSCGGSSPKLTVQGTGLATGTPNILTVSVGINVTDPTANEALADDNTKAAAVTGVLTQAGVASKDVQTSDLSINPQYNIHGVITGYQVTNTLTAVIRNFTTAGTVIDSIAGAAGNATQLNSVDFSVEDTRGLEDEARTDAVRQAVSHAKSMAEAAGERLGPVCSLSDQSQTGIYAPEPFADQAAGVAKSAASVPLEPGSQQETAQVSMVYALMPPPLRK
ncbi:MAG TPA: SIMPL domain-containing protein [Acidimicrobiales bacterium]|nr:SIMPL domain-containing protein [Acidimicrobiales bacterium]